MKKELIAMTFAAATPALADAPLLSRQLDGLLSGNTLYIATPSGVELRGAWRLGEDHYSLTGRTGRRTPAPRCAKLTRRS